MEQQTKERRANATGNRIGFVIAMMMQVTFVAGGTVVVVRQTAENKRVAAEVCAYLTGKSAVWSDWQQQLDSVLYQQRGEVSFLEDGTANITFSNDNENQGEQIENTTSYSVVEEHNRSSSTEPWSVEVSLWGKITVKIGTSRFIVHMDERGNVDYLTQDGYKMFFLHTQY